MGFQFRYESLLNLRRHQKEKEEIEHARALGDVRRGEETLQTMEKEYGRVQSAFAKAMSRAAPTYEVRNYADYLKSLRARVRKQVEKIQDLKGILAKKREELLGKTKEYKVIETLRDKDFEKCQKRENELEQKRINELAVLRHGRTYV